MTTNTDPVRALIADWRESAADTKRYSASDYADGYAAAESNCANRLEAALASAPPSAPEPEVHSYDPTEHRESVTIRWPDGKCLGYVLDRTRYTDNLPPSAPVGVDGLAGLLEQIRDLLASLPVDCLGTGTAADGQPYPIRDEVIHGITKALAQQPAAPSDEHLIETGCYQTVIDRHSQPATSAEPPYEIDALFDALSNLEHDNYERSYSGSKNREADAGLIRAALERYATLAAQQQGGA